MIKKAFALGLSAGLLGGKLLDKAVKELNIPKGEAKKILGKYAHDSKKKALLLKREVENIVKEKVKVELKKAFDKVGVVSKNDYRKLEMKYSALEKRLGALERSKKSLEKKGNKLSNRKTNKALEKKNNVKSNNVNGKKKKSMKKSSKK